MNISTSPLRTRLDSLLFYNLTHKVLEIPGFRLLQLRDQGEDSQLNYCCYQYVFGIEGSTPWKNDQSFLRWRLNQRSYDEVEDFRNGDLLVYSFGEDHIPVHVGIARNKGYAHSKFGFGNVYKHPISIVPTYYGNRVMGFRKRDYLD